MGDKAGGGVSGRRHATNGHQRVTGSSSTYAFDGSGGNQSPNSPGPFVKNASLAAFRKDNSGENLRLAGPPIASLRIWHGQTAASTGTRPLRTCPDTRCLARGQPVAEQAYRPEVSAARQRRRVCHRGRPDTELQQGRRFGGAVLCLIARCRPFGICTNRCVRPETPRKRSTNDHLPG